MPWISTEVSERLELDLIDMKKSLNRYTLDEMIIHDDILLRISRGIELERKKIMDQIEDLEANKKYLRDALERLSKNHQIFTEAITKTVKDDRKRQNV
jgi:hypothetical protein